jgi:hypothetical protein
MQDPTQWPTVESFLSFSNEELSNFDPLVMNLIVAKGIPALADLDIRYYVNLADEWGNDLRARIPVLEGQFRQTPKDWRNDIDFFLLGLVCWYVDEVLGVSYREDQRDVTQILYTDPTDLFLNGVMDSRRGTCGNLCMLHVVLGRRIGLPVSLACVGSHFICRFDNGIKTINIETTDTGRGGFASRPDEYVLNKFKLPAKAQNCGSDLRAVTSREMLGLFVGLRARHLDNSNRLTEAEMDYLLARYLFPRNRQLYISLNQVSVQCSMDLFEPHEKGHPTELLDWLHQYVHVAPWVRNPIQKTQQQKEKCNGNYVDALFQQIIVGGDF